MEKKIVVYEWGSVSEPLFCRALQQLGREYIEFSMKMKNYHADAEFAMAFIKILHGNQVQAVFSYDYFPLISMICEMNQVPYIAWIYDCPQYTLLSRTLSNSCNYIFCFDREYTKQLAAMGARHCFHYPLAGDTGWYEQAKRNAKTEQNMAAFAEKHTEAVQHGAGEKGEISYACDISFVGNLYNDKRNRFRQAELSPYAAGAAEGLISAQLLIYGANFVKDAIPDAVVEEMAEKCHLSLSPEYLTDERRMTADVLNMEVSARERERVLEIAATVGKDQTSAASETKEQAALAEERGETAAKVTRKIHLYTASELPFELKDKNIKVKGYANYEKEVPLIFHNSKINLNITSKTITSGIPQRVFDILSCGGFCLTNYQPEIAEYFTDGEELVMYTDMADLQAKIEYYLIHEEERKQIAENGLEKIRKEFSLEKRVGEILEVMITK